MKELEITIYVDGLSYTHKIRTLDDVEMLKAICNGLEEKAFKIAQGNQPAKEPII